MPLIKKISTMFFLLLCLNFNVARSQTESRHFKILYVINIAEIDPTFVDNESRIDSLKSFLRMIKNDDRIVLNSVRFSGTASPDGTIEFNRWLCENRLENFKKLIRSELEVPDCIIFANTAYIPWDEFRQRVAESDLQHRDEILSVIDQEPGLVLWFADKHTDHRLLKLRSMYGGKVWDSLKKPILFDLRFADAEFEIYRKTVPLKQNVAPVTALSIINEPLTPPQIIEWGAADEWVRRLHLKTNFVDLALLIANFAVEVDLAPHWSFSLPVYYSAIDYFKSTVKFRMLGTQPEFRYWFSRNNDGLFAGAHFGISYYNFAFNGDFRYQDHNATTPTKGGGVSFGYRKLLGNSKRWRLEFSAGAGIYPLDYDLFYNTPDVKDGQLADRHKKTFIGLDQAAVTLAYSFDIQHKYKMKKGGRK